MSIVFLVLLWMINVYFGNIIPLNEQDSSLYYKIGGGDSYGLPPVSRVHRQWL